MNNYFDILKNVALFKNIAHQDLSSLLNCLSATVKTYEKGELIFTAGQPAKYVGIVCSGSVHVFTEDFMGNRTILTALGECELFGEAFACAKTERLPVSVVAVTSCEIMIINYRKIITTCPQTCIFHSKLIENMLGIVASKNVALSQKLEIIAKRNTRDKLTAYLSAQAIRSGKRKFSIPFDRQGLADFLGVERSAMSAELSKMQKEGLLKTNRSEFDLLALSET